MLKESDSLAPARGCLFGLLLATLLWALIIGALWIIFSGGDRESVPEAVLKDHMSQGVRYSDVTGPVGDVMWTTREIAYAEFERFSDVIDVAHPPFGFHIKYMGRQGMVTYKTVHGELVLDMYLPPLYHSVGEAQANRAHELSHTYAIWYLADYSEATAWTLAACYGSSESREWIRTVVKTDPTVSDCEVLKAKLVGARED